jgi:hypothetical protein
MQQQSDLSGLQFIVYGRLGISKQMREAESVSVWSLGGLWLLLRAFLQINGSIGLRLYPFSLVLRWELLGGVLLDAEVVVVERLLGVSKIICMYAMHSNR